MGYPTRQTVLNKACKTTPKIILGAFFDEFNRFLKIVQSLMLRLTVKFRSLVMFFECLVGLTNPGNSVTCTDELELEFGVEFPVRLSLLCPYVMDTSPGAVLYSSRATNERMDTKAAINSFENFCGSLLGFSGQLHNFVVVSNILEGQMAQNDPKIWVYFNLDEYFSSVKRGGWIFTQMKKS